MGSSRCVDSVVVAPAAVRVLGPCAMPATRNGRWRSLRVVRVAMSCLDPPGQFPQVEHQQGMRHRVAVTVPVTLA